MIGYPGNQLPEVIANFGAFYGGRQSIGQAAQFSFFFRQNNFKALIGQTQRRIHAGHTAANDQAPLDNRNLLFFKGMQGVGPGHGHTHKILGLFGGRLFGIGMDPGILVADVGHFK